MFDHEPHGAPHLDTNHSLSPNQFWRAVGANEIGLGVTVTEDVDMRGRMVVREDNHP